MKTGKDLRSLADEIVRQQASKKDYIVPTQALTVVADPNEGIRLKMGETLTVGINDLAHRQIGERLGIPSKYADRMRHEAPELLAENINTWFQRNPTKNMVRTLDGNARAFLSERFRPLDNEAVAEAVLPVLLERNLQVLSCEITERRLYIKAVDVEINRQVPKGGNRMGDGSHVIFDCCSPGIVISNSEVGLGPLSVETSVWTKACTNLAIFKQHSMRKTHVGGKNTVLGEDLYELLTDKTRALTDAATWAQVKDVVAGAFDLAKFDARIKQITDMSTQIIEGDVPKVVEVVAKRFDLQDGERASILKHLISGGDLTRYGVYNAITRTAEDLQSYDRATDFERLGGEIIELGANDWEEIAKAA